ncbi:MAG: putative zinc-binding protein [Anaerolineaceae bacterium]|nr:putative zinc-binding protein [Anaerolineaceae bacterium]
MPDLPKKKVGIVACSGEELPEGTITRLAALKVLEKLRPEDTVTICLPLFLAGGEGDRAFAKFYPTIAVDGCEKRCAYRGTQMYSNKPAAGIVVTELVAQQNLGKPAGRRRLNADGLLAVDEVARQIAGQVDGLIGKTWNRSHGEFARRASNVEPAEEVTATCSCGSGIPIQKIMVKGQEMTLVALPLIFQNAWEAQKTPSDTVVRELMDTVKIYNAVDQAEEAEVYQAVSREYAAYCQKH